MPIVSRITKRPRVELRIRSAGMDATVYFPLVDFQFKNEWQYWILMETHVGSDYLTWQFYSTPDGRSVTINRTGSAKCCSCSCRFFCSQPGFETQPDESNRSRGEWCRRGVTRTVTKNGAVYFQDEYKTHYEPWQAICEYAPDIQNPADVAKHKGLCQPPAVSMVQ